MTSSAPPLFSKPPLPRPLAALPAALNHLLAAEPWARQRLSVHAGKTVQISMAPFPVALSILPEGLVELAEPGVLPNVSIQLPNDTLWAALTRGSGAAFAQAEVEGDVEFAQDLSFVAQNLRWDVEEDLSKFIGDALAHRLNEAARAGLTGARRAGSRLGGNVAEYLLDEKRQLVRPRDIVALTEAVRSLRDDLARLEKRVERRNRT